MRGCYPRHGGSIPPARAMDKETLIQFLEWLEEKEMIYLAYHDHEGYWECDERFDDIVDKFLQVRS